MRRGIKLISVNLLKVHEAVIPDKVNQLVIDIGHNGYLRNPLVVDRKSLVILDGHHRFAALKKLGVMEVPVQLINYQNSEVRVYLRRKELLNSIIKRAVVRGAKIGRLFPNKTTRHLIKKRIRNLNITIESLKDFKRNTNGHEQKNC
jgi:hypothetical protein